MSPDSLGVSALDVKISGRVQGVGFRYRAMWAAESEDLTGWIRNEDDGTVALHVEGPDHRVERFMKVLRAGFPGVSISRVAASKGAVEGFTKFRVQY